MKEHKCKEKDKIGILLSIVYEKDFGWFLQLDNGVVIDIIYCPYCSKRLSK